jgi:RimJ/RimL family protein N-acetyltransferase
LNSSSTWAHQEQQAGQYACFAVAVEGSDAAIALFQVRQLDSNFGTAEWGFALGSPFWGAGIFPTAARLVLDFAFRTLGVYRLEARASVRNGRGNGALEKIGAVREGVLRRSFLRNGIYDDQILWSIVADDWSAASGFSDPITH